jgi:hypothetical protein
MHGPGNIKYVKKFAENDGNFIVEAFMIGKWLQNVERILEEPIHLL